MTTTFNNQAYQENLAETKLKIGRLGAEHFDELKVGQLFIVQHYIGHLSAIPWLALVGKVTGFTPNVIFIELTDNPEVENVDFELKRKLQQELHELGKEITFRRLKSPTLLLKNHTQQTNCRTFLTDYDSWRTRTKLAN